MPPGRARCMAARHFASPLCGGGPLGEPVSELKKTVRRLEGSFDTEVQLSLLQQLCDQLLTRFCLRLGEDILLPLWVEAYYYHPGKFEDNSAHLSPLQQDRFGRLYIHKKGYGGADICLSMGEYYLSCLLKYSLVNGVFLSQLGLRDLLKELRSRDPELDERAVLSPLPEGMRDDRQIFHSPRKGLGDGPYRFARLASLKGVGEYPYRYEKGFGKTRLLSEQR